MFSRVGFLQICLGSGFVPVGAGEVGMWRGDPCGRPSSFHRQVRGRPQGSPPNPSPPPPLRGRGTFSPKNLPVEGKGMPLLYGEEASQAAPCIVGALGLRGRRHPLRSPWPLWAPSPVSIVLHDSFHSPAVKNWG